MLQSQSLEQKQILRQDQLQSLEILAMNNIELNQFMQNEYLENPLLECTESNELGKENISDFYEYNVSNSKTFEESIADNDKRHQDIKAMDSKTIENYLLSQLKINIYTEQEWNLFKYLINNLDETGFFTISIKEIAIVTKIDESVIESQLNILKDLEPCGVFAKTLQEYLLKQLEVKNLKNSLSWKIVKNFFDDVATSKFSNISRGLKISTAEVRKSIVIIASLNSRPLQGFNTSSSQYIISDIVITMSKNKLVAKLNDNFMANYKVNDYYIKMMRQSDDEELVKYFQNKLDKVKFIFSCVEQRQKTILSICNEVIKYQSGFFTGKSMLTQITMNELGKKIGVHPSTVSRAVNGKYVQYPSGTTLMKNLFSNKISEDNNMSVEYVKNLIKGLIFSEDKNKPLSDENILKILRDKNISISRRVIAKYRDEMGIKNSYRRLNGIK
ncbi:MAG: RNA polymerase factor sigma-54 [Lachnospirales bacterium]